MLSRVRLFVHNIINPTELPNSPLGRLRQALEAANIHPSKTDDLRSFARRLEVLCHCLGLLDIAADDGGVGSQVNEGSYLSRADRACATGAEDNFSGCSGSAIISKPPGIALLKMPSRQTLETYSLLGKGIMTVGIKYGRCDYNGRIWETDSNMVE